jgi:hypothetical protein
MMVYRYGRPPVWVDVQTPKALLYWCWLEVDPPVFRKVMAFLAGVLLSLGAVMPLGEALLMFMWPLMPLGGAAAVWATRYRSSYVDDLTKQGLVAQSESYAFRALERALKVALIEIEKLANIQKIGESPG